MFPIQILKYNFQKDQLHNAIKTIIHINASKCACVTHWTQ